MSFSPASSHRLPRLPRAVVFDLDGTLIDSEAMVREGYMAAAHHFGVSFTDDDFLSLIGLHRAANDARMQSLLGPDFPLEDFYAAVTARIGDRSAPLKPGASEILDLLDARGLPFALATSSGPDWVNRHFTAHDLHRRFQHVVTRDDVANRKPHPEPYLKAATALGVDPTNILALEDSPTGFASASSAGMMTVLIPDLLQPDDDLRARACLIGTSLHDVLTLLEA
ncbi:MAG: HAD family phosphatase [Hyphomonadaceae bacterium]